MKDLIELLNSEIQKDSCDEFPSEDIRPQIEALGYRIKYKSLQGELDEHRWYSLRYAIFEVYKNDTSIGFIMSKMIVQMRSEQSDYEDIYFTPNFCECEPVEIKTIIYKKIGE